MADADKKSGVVVGIGFFFAFLMMGISWLQNRYTTYSTKQSEEFNTASRSVKPGLIASGIVSAWTWAATLLQSATVSSSLANELSRLIEEGRIYLRCRRTFLVCCGCHSTDLDVLSSGMQDKAECAPLPYLSRDHQRQIRHFCTSCVYAFCFRHEYPCWKPAPTRWKCRRYIADGHECLCCHLPNSHG
jgi:hypothetical protein